MGFVSLLGHFLVGVGPPLVFFVLFISRRSFVVLVTLASAFYYLVVFLLTASLLRGLVPLDPSPGPHAGALAAAVAIETAARYLLWVLHRMTTNTLADTARRTGKSWSPSDALHVSVGFGFGQGAAHAVFFFLAALPLLAGEATYYVDRCPQMSYFLTLALLELGFSALHTAGTVVFFSGLSAGEGGLRVWGPPLLHLAAAMCTLASFREGGCAGSVPAVGALAAGTCAWAVRVAVAEASRRPGLIRTER
ncbi:unnamed protein product [Ostreobium quekettii]|uniref:Aph-1 n=1 Tax=Ostreobium quekettii TaxID=121088 RepID=A0A8S1IT25_9CHLO|nr:unnamed protein product [Ostreobium quekettii]|eukprot:evm.model.scf_1258.2 EVM.evm.TU.scf_1258.2   scf_1258:16407-17156(-)